MGLFSSIFGNKKKTTSEQTSTTTPVVPEWVQTPIQSLTSTITGLGNADPYSFIAPASDLQKQAWSDGANLGKGPDYMGGGADLIAAAGLSKAPQYAATTYDGGGYSATSANAQSVLTDLDKYMSPYRDQVVKTTLNDFDFSAGQQRAQDDLDLAASGAFGGSGAALTKSLTADNLARARASTESNILDQMFQRGTALSSEDAARRQQAEIANAQAANEAARFGADAKNRAAEFNAGNLTGASRDNANFEAQSLDRLLNAGKGLVDTGSAVGANDRANLATLSALGDNQRGVQQDYLNAPLTMLGFQTGQLQNLPLALFSGQTTASKGKTVETKTPSPFDVALEAAKVAAMFSDERLKTDVVRVGTRPDGIGLYEYRYIWGGDRRVGVMAQEVQTIKPEAVVEHETGWLMVNHEAL